jgi:hypothetical protein
MYSKLAGCGWYRLVGVSAFRSQRTEMHFILRFVAFLKYTEVFIHFCLSVFRRDCYAVPRFQDWERGTHPKFFIFESERAPYFSIPRNGKRPWQPYHVVLSEEKREFKSRSPFLGTDWNGNATAQLVCSISSKLERSFSLCSSIKEQGNLSIFLSYQLLELYSRSPFLGTKTHLRSAFLGTRTHFVFYIPGNGTTLQHLYRVSRH